MTIANAIRQLEAEFQAAPIKFTVEQAVQTRLQSLLRGQIDRTVLVRGGYSRADITNYKEKYLQRLADPHKISAVLPEVNFGNPGANERLDLAVLRPVGSSYDELDEVPPADRPIITVRLVDGTKYFHPSVIEHAIEIKYIKNKDIAGAGFESTSLDDWPHFERDLQKLGSLDTATSRHLVICTNKNPFQQDERDSRGTEKARRRFERVQHEAANRDIQVTEIHPRR